MEMTLTNPAKFLITVCYGNDLTITPDELKWRKDFAVKKMKLKSGPKMKELAPPTKTDSTAALFGGPAPAGPSSSAMALVPAGFYDPNPYVMPMPGPGQSVCIITILSTCYNFYQMSKKDKCSHCFVHVFPHTAHYLLETKTVVVFHELLKSCPKEL